jgi:hypothetical protein
MLQPWVNCLCHARCRDHGRANEVCKSGSASLRSVFGKWAEVACGIGTAGCRVSSREQNRPDSDRLIPAGLFRSLPASLRPAEATRHSHAVAWRSIALPGFRPAHGLQVGSRGLGMGRGMPRRSAFLLPCYVGR